MWWKAILLYVTIITIMVFICGFKAIALSAWFIPMIVLIFIEIGICNRFITLEEMQKLLLIYDPEE